MSTLNSLDLVTQSLISQGLQPEIAYFGKSDFVMGWRVCFGDLDLVYRLEDNVLTICDFAAIEGAQGVSGAVSQFILLIHRIERSVKQLHSVRGRFTESCANPEINRVRGRLASVLQAKGASWQEIDGDPWLVYPLTLNKQSSN